MIFRTGRFAIPLATVLEGYGYDPVIQEVPLPNGTFAGNVIAEYTPAVSPAPWGSVP